MNSGSVKNVPPYLENYYTAMAEKIVQQAEEREAQQDINWSEQQDAVKFSFDAVSGKTENKFNIKTSMPKSNLTSIYEMLVSAKDVFSARAAMAEATKESISLQKSLIGLEGKERAAVQALIRKANKLIDRAGQKIDALNKEEGMAASAKRAEQLKKQLKAAQIKKELRQKQNERERKEQGYLQEEYASKINDALSNSYGVGKVKSSASEYEIAKIADEIAAAMTSAGSGAAESGGAEAAGIEAGGAAVAVASGGAEAAAVAE